MGPEILACASGLCGLAASQLIRPRSTDDANQPPQIEIVLGEISRQHVESSRQQRGIAWAKIIDWLDESAAEEQPPHAIDDRLGKIRVVFCRDPLGQFLSPAAERADFLATEQLGPRADVLLVRCQILLVL